MPSLTFSQNTVSPAPLLLFVFLLPDNSAGFVSRRSHSGFLDLGAQPLFLAGSFLFYSPRLSLGFFRCSALPPTTASLSFLFGRHLVPTRAVPLVPSAGPLAMRTGASLAT